MTPKPFWWINKSTANCMEAVRNYYESTPREKWTEDGLKRKLSGLLNLLKKYKSDELHGVQEFQARLQLLLEAMNVKPNGNRDEAIRLLLRAARLHYDEDQTLAGIWHRRCETDNCWDQQNQVAAVVWEEHSSSPIRVQLLNAADTLQRQAEELL
ncbi:hypothetical protein [Shimazuella alba]|uniref:Uncharacterized protein n=1 Tax=Shimazuella alba TaxID=2690964 RepID=A0A6I4VU24_9BACL|nr:hypothetical protein [Shimazuella alba]MXQ55289.1 hypothetical protein [Shimazuella alba]